MKLAKLPELEQSADDCGADDDCHGDWRWQLVLYYFVVFLLLAYHHYKCSYYSCCCYYHCDKYSHNDGDYYWHIYQDPHPCSLVKSPQPIHR